MSWLLFLGYTVISVDCDLDLVAGWLTFAIATGHERLSVNAIAWSIIREDETFGGSFSVCCFRREYKSGSSEYWRGQAFLGSIANPHRPPIGESRRSAAVCEG